MNEKEMKFLEAAFLKTFNYDPDEDEVDARYDDEFNKWCDELVKNESKKQDK